MLIWKTYSVAIWTEIICFTSWIAVGTAIQRVYSIAFIAHVSKALASLRAFTSITSMLVWCGGIRRAFAIFARAHGAVRAIEWGPTAVASRSTPICGLLEIRCSMLAQIQRYRSHVNALVHQKCQAQNYASPKACQERFLQKSTKHALKV